MKPRSFHAMAQGNILFIILIAIGLLAALTWSMTKSSRTMSAISAEDTEFAAQNIMSYLNAVTAATEHVMVANGCRDDQVSFENPVVAGYTNANAPADKRCHIFDPAGGGLKWETPDPKWLDTAFSANALYGQYFIPDGRSCIYDVGTGDAVDLCSTTTSKTDLYIVLPLLKSEICLAINKKLEINLPDGTPPVDGTNAWTPLTTKFTGTFSTSSAVLNLGVYRGRHTACFEAGGTPPAGSFNLYQVLIPR